MQWTDRAVRAALGLDGGRDDLAYRLVSTDSRTIQPGDLFVALVGDRFDGHTFLDQVRKAGAAAAIVRIGTPSIPGLVAYPVADTLVALGGLARHRRRQLNGPVVAITGTNGKTSTKEMIARVVGVKYQTHATKLNLNNLVGVPQTILEAPASTEALVVEAGANLPGEIPRYRAIIEPTITVITNVAPGHLEGFGSLDGVMAEKVSLADGVPVAIVGTDPPELAAQAKKRAERVVTAGLEKATIVPDECTLGEDGRPRLVVEERAFTLPLLGLHQAKNAMLAWAVGVELDLDRSAMALALETVALPGGRGELAQIGHLTILNDCYNANPASFRAAIETAAALRQGRRLVFVAGTMRELGPDSARLHEEIAQLLVALGPELLAAVGEFAEALEPFRSSLGDRLITAPDALDLAPRLADRLDGTELVVLKGSRGVALERIIPVLSARTSHPSNEA